MKLVLHIGGAKCGSSAIQNFLRDNAVTMKSSGILVPSAQLDMTDDVRGQEIDFFASLINREDAELIVFDRLNALRTHMQQIGQHTLVLSAENLINPDNFQNLFVNAQDLFDIQIVAYVRRQDDYFASAWQQWHLKIYPSLQAYVDDRLGKDANWAQMLARVVKKLGRAVGTSLLWSESTAAGHVVPESSDLLRPIEDGANS